MNRVYLIVSMPNAINDVQDAFDWYESKQQGLGDAFVNELEKFSEALATFPFKHRIIKNEIRLGVLQRFPYLVYYEIIEDVVYILSVVYGGRHPNYWEERKGDE